jgi:hypothetical protein
VGGRGEDSGSGDGRRRGGCGVADWRARAASSIGRRRTPWCVADHRLERVEASHETRPAWEEIDNVGRSINPSSDKPEKGCIHVLNKLGSQSRDLRGKLIGSNPGYP